MEENNVPDQIESHALVTPMIVQWTETGEPGKLGRHVQKPVALERKSVRACAVTRLRATVARNAREKGKDHVNVTCSHARLMDSGMHGRDGKLVQSPVVVAFRSECEDVAIQLLQMAAETAEEHASRRHFAINRLVQLTVNGVNGSSGLLVQELVGLDGKLAREHAATRDPPMVARTVWGALTNLENAVKKFVQLTVAGVIGRTGNNVQVHVDLEHSNECACALNRVQLSGEETASVAAVKPDLAKKYHAQLMARGETGRTGNPVRQHVVLELSNECACAQIHVLYLEEETVLVAVASQGPAEECLVQWTVPGVSGRDGSNVLERVELGHSNVYARVLDHALCLAVETVRAQVGKLNRVN